MADTPIIDTSWILSHRGKKNHVEAGIPYAYTIEKERGINGDVEDVITIFLTNRECAFKCLMCDLWKNTLDHSVEIGDIPKQIEFALSKLPPAKHIKLYNSGNFFDSHSIPKEDYGRIISLLSGFETVIVECHPNLINEEVLEFRDRLSANLQIALGLETVHPEILRKLNKKMNLEDFRKSIDFLSSNGIASRAFILLKAPFMNEKEGVLWAKKSMDFAFDSGVECCVIIPTRAGNGALDWLHNNNYFSPPTIQSLEEVVEYGLA
jgi:radical SAM enzyme (TIGR01210 family)